MRSLGSIRETKDKDTFRIVLSVGKDATGKRLRQWETVKGTRRDAERRLNELLHQYHSGVYDKPTKLTVGKFLEQWLSDYCKVNISPKSYDRYESIVEVHLIPALGKKALTLLRPEHIQAHYTATLSAGLRSRTVRYHHSVLHKALETAMIWGLVPRNVSDSVEVPKFKRVELQTWNALEVQRFLENAKDSPYYALFYLALFTGMRRSELLGLRWENIDFIFSQISVTRGLHQLRNGEYVFTQPKSATSRRTIALPPSAILALNAHHDKAAMDRAVMGVELSDQDLVFCKPDGFPLRPNTISRAWEIIATQAGIKVIRFHDARHTHASLMLKQGIHPKIVSERLGHASIQITLDTYSHVAPGLQQAAAQRFDEAFTEAGAKNRVESWVEFSHYDSK